MSLGVTLSARSLDILAKKIQEKLLSKVLIMKYFGTETKVQQKLQNLYKHLRTTQTGNAYQEQKLMLSANLLVNFCI